jgi:hypothetical protein
MTGLMTGLLTILFGFLLMFLTPEPARATAADDDFAARCKGATAITTGAGGVLRCFSFDDASQLPRTLGAGNLECWGCDYGVMANSGNLNVPVIDTTVKASGGGSMRQLTPGGSGSSGAGHWFTHFGPNKTHQLNQGDEIYVQYRYRTEAAALNPSLWPGGGGFKQDIFSLGDLPSCGPGTYGNSTICTTTCQTATMVTQNSQARGKVTMYANCNGPQAYTEPDNVTGGTIFTQPAFAAGCPYPGPYTEPNCVTYHANEWMTFKKYLKMGTFNNFDSVMKLWVGREGRPLQLIYHCGPGAPRVCNYGHDGQTGIPANSTGWTLFGAPICDSSGSNCHAASEYKMGKVYLLSYQTCEDSTQCANGYPGSPDTNIWYDELIISTQDIADPGGVASSKPSAPTGLRVSGLLTATSPSALSGLAMSVVALALLMRDRPGGPRVKRRVRALMSAARTWGRRS